MKYLSILLLCFMSLLMSNCATSGSFNPALTKQGYAKKFSTSIVGANFRYTSGGLGNSASIQYQVQAYCKNNCNTAKAVLSFYITSSGNTVYINNHNLSIYAGGKNYHWNKDVLPRRFSRSSGRITAVILNESELKQIAKSKKVTGVIAGDHFNWSYGNRKPLRLLVQKLEKGSK